MAYGNIAARHRMGLSARAYSALYQWTVTHVPGFGGRHEDMAWSVVAGVSAGELLAMKGCGHAVVDEIAAAMKRAGLTLADHSAEIDRPLPLARGSKVYLAGRSRPLVVADYAAMGDDVLVRLRSDGK